MVRWHKKDVIIALYVKPNARQTQVMGLFQDSIKIQIAAPAVENKANDYLRKWIAQAFSVPQSRVILEQGQQSRYKIFRVKEPIAVPEIFKPFLKST